MFRQKKIKLEVSVDEFGLDLWTELIISNDLSNFDIFNLSLTCKFLCQLLKKEKLIQYIEGNRKIHFGVYAHLGGICTVAWSHNNRVLAFGDQDGKIDIWNANTGRIKKSIKSANECIHRLAFHPQNAALLAVGYECGTLYIWDVEKNDIKADLESHTGTVSCLAFHPQGHILASGSFDHIVRVWDAESGICEQKLNQPTGPIFDIEFTSDGKFLGASTCDGKIFIWDVENFGVIRRLIDNYAKDKISFQFFNDNQTFLFTNADNEFVKVYDFKQRKEKIGLRLNPDRLRIYQVILHPNQKLIALCGKIGFEIWDIQNNKLFENQDRIVRAFSFSPNGSALAVVFFHEKIHQEVYDMKKYL